MLHYSRGDVLATVYWWGGINRVIFWPALVYLLFVFMVYLIQRGTNTFVNCSREGIHSLAGFVVFLLVFRLNQCMARYNEGHHISANLFSGLEQIVCCTLCSLKGMNTDTSRLIWPEKPEKSETLKPEVAEQFAQLAVISKVNVIRLCLALGVSYLMHSKLQDVVSDQVGYLYDFQMRQVMFLYFRLQCLLYEEEMEQVDQVLHIYENTLGSFALPCRLAGRRRFRAEVSRHVIKKDLKEPIIGDVARETGEKYEGKSISPLPKVVASMLYRALLHPLEQPWGYPQRMMNVFAQHMGQILTMMAQLDIFIKVPLPLIYLQHCRCLLLIFGMCYPMSINPTDGLMDNVMMPLFIVWSMLGFEFIAEQLENPLGDDDADINLWDHLHNLEVYCKQAFDNSEMSLFPMKSVLYNIAEDFDMDVAREISKQMPDEETTGGRKFETYFSWLPLPSLLSSHLVDNHGQARLLHEIRWGAGVDAVGRAMQRWRMRAYQGNNYDAVDERVLDCDLHRIKQTGRVMECILSDPTNYTHYLVFRGCHARLVAASTHGDLAGAAAIDEADRSMRLARARSKDLASERHRATPQQLSRFFSLTPQPERRRSQGLMQACEMQSMTVADVLGNEGAHIALNNSRDGGRADSTPSSTTRLLPEPAERNQARPLSRLGGPPDHIVVGFVPPAIPLSLVSSSPAIPVFEEDRGLRPEEMPLLVQASRAQTMEEDGSPSEVRTPEAAAAPSSFAPAAPREIGTSEQVGGDPSATASRKRQQSKEGPAGKGSTPEQTCAGSSEGGRTTSAPHPPAGAAGVLPELQTAI